MRKTIQHKLVLAAVAQIALFGVVVTILFARPSGLLGVERR